MLDKMPNKKDKAFNAPTCTYVCEARTTASTTTDVKEYPDSYFFIIDMPGLNLGDIKVQVKDDNVLVISGERKRAVEEKEWANCVRMERRVGKFIRKFVLSNNVSIEKISIIYQDGVLTVIIEKLPPPKPKKPKTIEVKMD